MSNTSKPISKELEWMGCNDTSSDLGVDVNEFKPT